MTDIFVLVAKVCVMVFFGVVFIGNLIGLIGPKKRGDIGAELYFEKQLWMLISLLVIAIVLGKM